MCHGVATCAPWACGPPRPQACGLLHLLLPVGLWVTPTPVGSRVVSSRPHGPPRPPGPVGMPVASAALGPGLASGPLLSMLGPCEASYFMTCSFLEAFQRVRTSLLKTKKIPSGSQLLAGPWALLRSRRHVGLSGPASPRLESLGYAPSWNHSSWPPTTPTPAAGRRLKGDDPAEGEATGEGTPTASSRFSKDPCGLPRGVPGSGHSTLILWVQLRLQDAPFLSLTPKESTTEGTPQLPAQKKEVQGGGGPLEEGTDGLSHTWDRGSEGSLGGPPLPCS